MTPAYQDHDFAVEEAAGEWCIRISSQTLSVDDWAAFEAWLQEDDAHSAAYDKALSVWHGTQAIGDAPEILGYRVEALEALRRANRNRWSRALGGRGWRVAAIAASLLLVVAAAIAIPLLGRDRGQQYVTILGERRSFALADGSRLSLDADTSVKVDYETGRRELKLLSGRARFDVARDAARPFTVTAGKHRVTATGTAFSVELVRDQLHVIVFEGHVEVSAVGASRTRVSVRRGVELVSMPADVAPRLAPADLARSGAWEGGQLEFFEEPLATAIERFNRYSPVKAVVEDADAAAIRVDGVFNANDIDAFVEAVSQVYPVRARKVDGRIILSNKSRAGEKSM